MPRRAVLLLLLLALGSAYDGPSRSDGYPQYLVPSASTYKLTGGCAYPGCAAGLPCVGDAAGRDPKCYSGRCSVSGGVGVCTSDGATCQDGVRNGWEVNSDCGGNCPPCALGNTGCFSPFDCPSGICTSPNGFAQFVTALVGSGTAATGDNGGGRCAPPSTYDTEQNLGESDIDCGQSLCSGYRAGTVCPYKCKDGFKCATGFDCINTVCQGHEFETSLGSLPISPAFCVPPSLSALNPAIGGRIRGGMRAPGVDKVSMDFQALADAVGFMIDVPGTNILPETLMNEYRSVEVGNGSYFTIRAAKGWRPYWEYPDARMRRELEGGGKGGEQEQQEAEGEGEQVHPPLQQQQQQQQQQAHEEEIRVLKGEGRAFLPGPNNAVEVQEAGFTLRVVKGGLGRPQADASPPSSPPPPYSPPRALQTYTKNTRPNAPYNLTLTDMVNATRVRWLAYVGNFEAVLLKDRMNKLFSLAVLPGGWAAEHALQVILDGVAQDAEFCQFYGQNYTLPSFNLTGVNCTQFLNCTTFPAVKGRVDGPWSTNDPVTGSAISSRHDYNETLDTTVLTQCYSNSVVPPSFPTIPSFSSSSSRRRMEEDERMKNATFSPSLSHPSPPNFDLTPSSSTHWLKHEYITARVREWVQTRCVPLWVASDGGVGELERAEGEDPIAADACPRRARKRVGGGGGEGVALRRGLGLSPFSPLATSSSVLSPFRFLTSTSFEMGLLPEVPRVTFSGALLATGLNYNTTVGPISLPQGGTLDTATYGRAAPDTPSAYLTPTSIRVLVDPRGTPASPLIRDAPFPIQPVVDLVDRHGRHVSTWKGVVTVTASIDTSLFDAALFAYATPSPSPTPPPVIGTHYTEPTVLIQSLYPDNQYVQLVAVPLQLLGTTSVVLDTTTGLAVFKDLYVTRVVPGLVLNFTAVFTTQQLSQRLTLIGSSRKFNVLIPPPSPLVLPTRFILPLAATIIFILMGLALLGFVVHRLRVWAQERQTRKSDMVTLPEGVERPGEAAVAGGGDTTSYSINPYPVYPPGQEEDVPMKVALEGMEKGAHDPPKGPSSTLPRFQSVKVHQRDEEDIPAFIPWKYLSGLATSLFAAGGNKKGKVNAKVNEKRPPPEVVAERLGFLAPPPPAKAPGAGLLPLPSSQIAAFDRVSSMLESNSARGRRVGERYDQLARMGGSVSARSIGSAREGVDEHIEAVLGHPDLSDGGGPNGVSGREDSAQEEQLDAAQRQEKAMGKSKRWWGNKKGEGVITGGGGDTGNSPRSSSSSSSSSGGGISSSSRALSSLPSSRGLGSIKPPMPGSNPSQGGAVINTSLMKMYSKRVLAAAPRLASLPPINRSLDVHDEPPSDAAGQAVKELANWAEKARARAKGAHRSLTGRTGTKTKTRGENRGVVGEGGGTAGEASLNVPTTSQK